MSTKPYTWFKPDKDQPRTHFNAERLRQLADTIQSIGIINPIEVDSSGTIITGERRYRAMGLCKMKTLTEGKEFVIRTDKMTPYQRFERQMIENLQQCSMSGEGEHMDPIDEAKGYQRLLEEGAAGAGRIRSGDKGYTDLAQRLGVNRKVIQRAISLLDETPVVIHALRREEITKSDVEEISRIKHPKAREIIQKRVLTGELSGAKNIREIARTIRAEPEKAVSLAEQSFTAENLPMREVGNRARSFIAALQKCPMNKKHKGDEDLIAIQSVERAEQACREWLAGLDLKTIVEVS